MTDTFRDALQEFHSAFMDKFFGNDTGLPPRLIKACNEAGQILCRKPEGLTDEELLELMPQQFRDDLATVSRTAAHGAGHGITPGIFRVSLNTGALDYARAAIAADRACYAHPTPQPPADGEVGELVEWLKGSADDERLLCGGNNHRSEKLDRAAELLERSTPQPVAVSERLPGPEDCIKRGNDHWCWGQERSLLTGQASARWRLMRVSALTDEAVNWLPFNALPLPQCTDD